ncbi:glycosyltransferase family 2 protein [Gillisia sp. Q332]|uniref:glycosyltransferase family 2 protein n=1 Tax=Gillisia xinjiangensis TaxID=3384765 RepID=UPI00391A160A
MNKRGTSISIIMATYNRSHLIWETIYSIIAQSFKDWECLIIDDGSTDGTKEILQPYLQNDSRLKYIERNRHHKKGLPGCRNQGLELAKGEYVIFFDDDDIVHPYLLELCFKEIQFTQVDYCRYLRTTFTGNFHYNFDNDLNFDVQHLNINHLDDIIMNIIPFNSCQVLWRKSNFINNNFNEELMYAEEWECYSRILSTGARGISIDKILFYGRKHANSNTGEFRKNDPIRRDSKIKAVKLIIDNLSTKRLLSPTLVQHFIRTGFILKENSIIYHALKSSGAGFPTKLKYNLGFQFYPLIRPVLKLKGRLKR